VLMSNTDAAAAKRPALELVSERRSPAGRSGRVRCKDAGSPDIQEYRGD
jgi:hypothetical protein